MIGRNYEKEKENVLKIVSEVLNTPRMTKCHIEIDATLDTPTTVDYECEVVVTGMERYNEYQDK